MSLLQLSTTKCGIQKFRYHARGFFRNALRVAIDQTTSFHNPILKPASTEFVVVVVVVVVRNGRTPLGTERPAPVIKMICFLCITIACANVWIDASVPRKRLRWCLCRLLWLWLCRCCSLDSSSVVVELLFVGDDEEEEEEADDSEQQHDAADVVVVEHDEEEEFLILLLLHSCCCRCRCRCLFGNERKVRNRGC